jgi:HSP20 family protein
MLMQFDPVREFDRFGRASRDGRADAAAVPMEASRCGDELVACFDLPGMAPGTIDLPV